ncbi:MAG: hypothetical protein KZQ70_01115 [gamma proteobacterium symbiont of Lucinoma myriamae]|nr:hypothetical protein [gamma proteobacterium symbiont of Lucinoma myriamae]
MNKKEIETEAGTKVNKKQAIKFENKKIILEYEIKEKTLEKEFNKNISEYLSAIEKNQFVLAEKYLTEAKLVKANEPIIIEIRQRISNKRNQVTINELILSAEKKEQWLQALKIYEKILSIDSDINSVIVKKQRANTYLKLNTILNKIIEKPERLNDDELLVNAKKLIQFVKLEIKEKQQQLYPLRTTPGLTRKTSTADKIISDASILIKVTIQ